MKTSRISALLLCIILAVSLCVPAFAEERTVHVSSRDELCELIAECRLDTYSEGLTVLLDCDIDLKNEPIEPFAAFSGTFDGQGHTISGLKLSTDGAHQGFFRYVQESAVIRDLCVQGTVSPENIRTETGGLCGTNYGLIEDCSFSGTVKGLEKTGGVVGENLGTVRNCTFSGSVSGKRHTGGIAGCNEGLIEGCGNSGDVNTTVESSSVDIGEINLTDISSIPVVTADAAETVSDTGGIAGLSTDSGVIRGCVNTGAVGYPHYGYNVGGVAGRQSGYTENCENRGSVFGRKDTGGVVGQMEPFMLVSAADDLIDELLQLSDALGVAMSHLGAGAYELGSVFDSLEDSAGSAIENALELGKNADADIPEEVWDIYDDLVNGGSGGDAEPAEKPDGESESGVDPEKVREEIGEAVEKAEEIEEKLGEDTIGDIISGDISEEDEEKIRDAAEDLAEDAEEAAERERQQAFDSAYEGLSDSMGSMSSNIGRLNASVTGTTSQLARDLQAVNLHFYNASRILGSLLNGDRVIYDDVSDEDSEELTEGKVRACVNYGAVEGDTGVGGIVGDMGIELDFDLEGLITGKLDSITSTTYAARCVVRQCVNNGVITGRKNNIGGIVGFGELGSVIACEGYGAVSSDSGSCVGGVAGRSDAVVRDSYAMCELSGEEYVGGIAGQGTKIIDCGSRVTVSAGIASVGAIAGLADVRAAEPLDEKAEKAGEEPLLYVRGNRFVGDELGGVDGVSYTGRAEPMTDGEFMALESVPERFKELTVTFTADGTIVKVLSGVYGGKIDPAEIPAVPQKEGFTGCWPETAGAELRTDTMIEAVYTAKQSSIASALKREGSELSIVLLSGSFDDGAELELSRYEGYELSVPGLRVLEKWEFSVKNGGDQSGGYSVRYLTPELTGRWERLAVYVLDGENWVRADTKSGGSYTVFDGSGDSMVFCAAAWQADDTPIYIAAGAGAAVIAAAGTFAAVRKRRKKAAAEASD